MGKIDALSFLSPPSPCGRGLGGGFPRPKPARIVTGRRDRRSDHQRAEPVLGNPLPLPPPARRGGTKEGNPSTVLTPDTLADLAVWALIEEAELTPKPGLVDRRGPGAHRDLDLETLRRSARALRPAFRAMAEAARDRVPDQALREELAAIGRAGEVHMMAATGGSNAHRGAIWALGLLLAGAAIAGPVDTRRIAAAAAAIAFWPDRFAPRASSNGERVRQAHGAAGARGEARAGFPHVVDIALPTLRASRAAGAAETEARLDALLAVMASLDDTCLLHRGGRPALAAAQSGARAVLAAGGTATPAGRAALRALDADLLSRWVSPGGSADLLAAALFLDRINRSFAPWNA
ncbi:triphosphoribosyl-dephospho-CoA synthase [Inquilinus sp. Marseille-Q2685]|uniref:triphosphoribosyl-dephospho-CoA synthase n=1 Tax=Inquilinus sp. Marseille-Q2685 TaxID=2866581 RepID=UPI001CE43328|nr:triphosphoribosyl-dephospho-CoA synthase [Inquilinus sp. Marseille-Q2685]